MKPLDLRPRVGLIVDFRNRDGTTQRFELLQIHGSVGSPRAAWRSRCSECGAEFTVTTPATPRAIRHRQGALWATKCREHADAPTKGAGR